MFKGRFGETFKNEKSSRENIIQKNRTYRCSAQLDRKTSQAQKGLSNDELLINPKVTTDFSGTGQE